MLHEFTDCLSRLKTPSTRTPPLAPLSVESLESRIVPAVNFSQSLSMLSQSNVSIRVEHSPVAEKIILHIQTKVQARISQEITLENSSTTTKNDQKPERSHKNSLVARESEVIEAPKERATPAPETRARPQRMPLKEVASFSEINSAMRTQALAADALKSGTPDVLNRLTEVSPELQTDAPVTQSSTLTEQSEDERTTTQDSQPTTGDETLTSAQQAILLAQLLELQDLASLAGEPLPSASDIVDRAMTDFEQEPIEKPLPIAKFLEGGRAQTEPEQEPGEVAPSVLDWFFGSESPEIESREGTDESKEGDKQSEPSENPKAALPRTENQKQAQR